MSRRDKKREERAKKLALATNIISLLSALITLISKLIE